jgi:hypothetical protein
MQSHGLRSRVTERPWDELVEEFQDLADKSPRYVPIVEILLSVISSGLASSLAATTSMHDLIIVTSPPPTVPFDAIRVSVDSTANDGNPSNSVTIRHQTVSGHDDQLSRSGSEAVSLFWRFVIEKFGLDPKSVPKVG